MFGAKSLKMAVLALAAASLVACGTTKAKGDEPEKPGPGQAEKVDKRPGLISNMFDKTKPNPAPCPLLGVLYDASRLVELRAPEEKLSNVGFTGEINGIHGLCTYSGTLPIEMSITIDMAFGKGPMADANARTYRYWVAVTRTNVAPLAKQYFDVPVKFDKNETRVFHTETIKKIVIPRANADIAGTAFEILVGFDLTPEQLAFNRAGKRFKVGPGPKPS